jgi:ribosome-binding factor A
MKLKAERAASDIQRELSNILLTETRDEDLKNVTITFVKVTNDVGFAKVYFTTLDDNKKAKVLKDINNAAGFFRSLLADRLDIRHVPELKFVYDDSIEYAKRLENIINEINKNED